MKYRGFYLILMGILGFLFTGRLFGQAGKTVNPPEWSYNQSIYEVNLRQYTSAGTINEFMTRLPRLKEMGVGILWLMPIHPIGELNRKGTLGSYYSVKDYYGLDPALGTKDDFRRLVKTVHSMGMYLIIDWVANHTAWDNELLKTNPDFYSKDSIGKVIAPVPDWTDVADLNYNNKALWEYMAGAMEYWVREFDIDGYRCDVAGMVPVEFWQYLRPKLDAIKPVFMLAEAEEANLHNNAFDMCYTWNFMHRMIEVAAGRQVPYKLMERVYEEHTAFPKNTFFMRFTTNHDENSWNGTGPERYGKALDCYNVLAATLPGMFLVYSGQEAGETKRLNFFEKDTIIWQDHPDFDLFKKLMNLKKTNEALWNGEKGGEFDALLKDSTAGVVSFIRYHKNKSVIVVINFEDKENVAVFGDRRIKGNLTELFTGRHKSNKGLIEFRLKPYEYQVWLRE